MLSVNGTTKKPNPGFQTPVPVIEAARHLLGVIDLDPASCVEANRRVQAGTYFGPDNAMWPDGLDVPWGYEGFHSRVFLNPPGGLGGVTSKWWRKLLEEYTSGRVSAAVFVCFSLEALQWSQKVNDGGVLVFPTFIPDKRIDYISPATGLPAGSPPKPSAIVWLCSGYIVGEAREYMTEVFRAQGIKGFTVGGTLCSYRSTDGTRRRLLTKQERAAALSEKEQRLTKS